MTDDLAIRSGQLVLAALSAAPRLLALRAGSTLSDAADPASAAPSPAPAPVDTGSAVPAASLEVPTFQAVPPQPAPAQAPAPATTAGASDFPTVLLSALVWVTAAAALVVVCLPARTREERDRMRAVTVTAAGLALMLAAAGVNYQITQGLLGGQTSYEEHHAWITSLPIHVDYHLAADGVSLPLLLVSTLVVAAVAIASWRQERRTKLYLVCLLLTATGVNGMLCAVDYVLFLLFAGLELVPLVVLVHLWGGEGGPRAARRLLATGLVSMGLLAACVVLAAVKADQGSFTFLQVSGAGGSGIVLSGGVATACFFLGLAAFGVRLPAVPFHAAVVDTIAEATPPVAALVAGLTTAVGGYGLLRIVLGGFPVEAHRFSFTIAVFAVVTVAWGAVGALGHDDLRRRLAHVCLAQLGVVLLAVSAGDQVAIDGAVLLLVANGLAAPILVLLAGTAQERTRARRVARIGGLATRMPKLAALFALAGLSVAGLPLLAGFTAELHVVTGSYPAHRVATIAVLVLSSAATAALLVTARSVLFGEDREGSARLRDIGALELVALIPLGVLLAGFGVAAGRILPVVNNGAALIAARILGA